jgi:hypothetical protein
MSRAVLGHRSQSPVEDTETAPVFPRHGPGAAW